MWGVVEVVVEVVVVMVMGANVTCEIALSPEGVGDVGYGGGGRC